MARAMKDGVWHGVLGVLLGASLAACGADDDGGADTDANLSEGSGTEPETASSPTNPDSAPTQGETAPGGSTTETGGDTLPTTGGPTTDDATDGSASGGEDETGDASTGGPVAPPAGLPCDQTFQHEGRQGCQSVIEGLEVKFFPLDRPVPAQRLVVFLHGDGGADYTENWGFRPEILDWALPQDYLVVGIRSPASYEGETAPSFGAAQPVHAEMVATTLEAFIDAYDVLAERALYWGISGGSWFTTSSYIPVAGHRVPGIFSANCGGSGVSFGWAWNPETDAATVGLNALLVNYGDQDFLAEPSAQSYAEYTELGFVTDQVVHAGATHCAHPISQPTLDFWTSQL